MKKSWISSLPISVLEENALRIALSIEELEYCLKSLLETKDELEATNDMLKNTLYNIENCSKDFKLKRHSLAPEKTTVSLIIQEDIQMKKRYSLPSPSPRQPISKRKSSRREIKKIVN